MLPMESERFASAAEIDPEFTTLLDRTVHGIFAATFDSLNTLYLGLFGYRRSMPTDIWQEYCRAARRHPLNDVLMQSPLTRRAFEKPRGYAGDAGTIDLIYGYGESPRGLSPVGEEIYRWERQTPGARSARARRDLLANTIDFVASSVREPRILSIACGHLREALCSEAIKSGAIGEFLALDQDAESLAVVGGYPFNRIKTVHASVRQILKREITFEGLDFVYAAGLYDYLPDSVATTLTATMFGMLRSGGRCLIANYCPDMLDIAYMDAYMDWSLVYREDRQIALLADAISRHEILTTRVFRDPLGNVSYCEVVKG